MQSNVFNQSYISLIKDVMDRRRHVRQLLLKAAQARARDALTLKRKGHETNLVAPFSPSPRAVIDAVWTKLEAAQMALLPTELLVDLGCGDGRWLISGVNRFKCHALGIEVDPQLVTRANKVVQMHPLKDQIEVKVGDIMLADISSAKLVIVYAFASSLGGIAHRLKEQLNMNALVLSMGVRA
ncbi:hypothetical protein PsorP6_014854 [Peronosclerospora sorghi]|uniref:Uncharacterized protein n=1 Tax=Peronosclerospora sorghi TaxID=230839 RepID=A0ACC0VRP5_9STRA|nr:hypothetical protein PsorP6_014854 [Peronosclerospora sorghi]